MRVIRTLAWVFPLVICSLFAFSPAHSQIAVGISVDVEPPPLPVYDQPPIPAPGYLWAPGYWAWDDDVGYYWVPGTWVLPPGPELLWTPGYWGWNDGVYIFHQGYWGPHIGFYGGVAYGFGYTGEGYEGGYWRGGNFFYNRSVNNITNVSITNVYNKTVIVNKTTNVSYNGGAGGTTARPTPEELAAANERHVPATAEQTRHAEASAKDPALALASNHGHPAIAATAHPGQFSGPGVIAAHPGKPIAAIEPEGHRVGGPRNPVAIPGNKIGPATAPAAQGHKVGPGNAAINPSAKPGPENHEHKGNAGGGPQPGASPATPTKKLPTNAARPPEPRIAKPAAAPTPQPHAVRPPPPAAHAAAMPPRRPAPPRPAAPPHPAKPKCQPGQHC